eukprot:TRINITY_DN66661_c13_g5_i1.p2 TRINITY_DN66661_c13_g5~~TRINITY_DN66661_c13_g5_i1.p2  ORF type:complete len:762 (+),score=442.62 TRINITY_DN66661_c13_g5_i1:295-2286(+)
MTNVLDGGKKKTARRRFILSPTKDKRVPDKPNWHRGQALKQHLKHFTQIHDEFVTSFRPTREDIVWMSESSTMGGTLMNHYGLFVTTIMGQGSDEQMMMWLPAAMTLKMIGCYAQTELGHGSNVRGLETVATYDKATQEFIIDTPTLRSIKWWPGTLGKVSTHALVYAQLILDGQEYGLHTFLVQIRDEKHRPIRGVEIGDLGPKLGDEANDTGFLRLRKIRVPRKHMLSKYQQVTADGRYIKSKKRKNDKMHYATMMYTRGNMMRTAGGMLARAATIATRYSCVREQGFVDTKGAKSYRAPERKIMDYQMQRYRILKQVALSFAIKFTGKWMSDRFGELEGDSDQAGISLQNVSALPEIAATSAGLKGLCTFLTCQGIEDCRKCCGGNGYLLSSGVAQNAIDYVWQTTAEGDWVILMLQTARFLMKYVRRAQNGESMWGPCMYLKPLADPSFDYTKASPRRPTSVDDFMDVAFLQEWYNYRALAAVKGVYDELQDELKSGKPYDDAWNSVAVENITTVRLHSYAFMLGQFAQAVDKAADAGRGVQAALKNVCVLFALSNIVDDQWAGFFSIAEMRLVQRALKRVLDLLRPDAVALVDAFDIPDRVLNSTIGRYDGNVYEALYESAKQASLNLRDPFDGYNELIKPRLDQDMLKTPNKLQSML